MMTKTKAARLAESIRQYWQRRGCEVNAWVEREPWVEGCGSPGWTVRTDLLPNGLPQGMTPEKFAAHVTLTSKWQ